MVNSCVQLPGVTYAVRPPESSRYSATFRCPRQSNPDPGAFYDGGRVPSNCGNPASTRCLAANGSPGSGYFSKHRISDLNRCFRRERAASWAGLDECGKWPVLQGFFIF